MGVMEYNVRWQITGCIADYSWCSVDVAGLAGWAAAQYLVVDQGGQIIQVDTNGAATGIPVVMAEGVAEVVAGPSVGVVVGPGGNVAAIVPEPVVIQYISATPVPAVAVRGSSAPCCRRRFNSMRFPAPLMPTRSSTASRSWSSRPLEPLSTSTGPDPRRSRLE